MNKEETALELEKLRADVAALSEARQTDAERAADKQQFQSAAAPESTESLAEIPDEQRSQLEELGDLLQQEIRDLLTITCLAVFSQGILIGRLMR